MCLACDGFHFQEVSLLPLLLLSRCALGRAQCPCSPSRHRALGSSLAASSPLSARCPPSSWGSYSGTGRNGTSESGPHTLRQRAWGRRAASDEAKSLLCLCLAAELLCARVILSPLSGMRRTHGNWQGCSSNAAGMGFVSQNAPRTLTKRQRGAAISCRGFSSGPAWSELHQACFGG